MITPTKDRKTSLIVSGLNICSLGTTTLTNTASKITKISEPSAIPIYNFGNKTFLEKNKNIR